MTESMNESLNEKFNYLDYNIVHEKEHYNLCKGDKFIASYDTHREAEDQLTFETSDEYKDAGSPEDKKSSAYNNAYNNWEKFLLIESMNEEKDLSKISGTISNVLSEDDGWKYCETVSDMLDYVKSVLDENGINTPASKRLIANISKKRSTADAMFVIYNSILAGTGNSVISDKKKYESTNIISKNNINESLIKILNK